MPKRTNAVGGVLGEEARRSWKSFFVAGQLLVETVEQALSASRLGPLSKYDALYTLSQAGEAGMTIRELSGSLAMSHSGLSRMLDRLQSLGLVEKIADAHDRRAVRLRLLDSGNRYLDEAWRVYADTIRRRFGEVLSPEELVELRRICLKLAEPLVARRERTTRTRFVHSLEG